MEEMQKILRTFHECREKYRDIGDAIQEVCRRTGLEIEQVEAILTASGVYVRPDSKEEGDIKRFIRGTKIAPTELSREIGFRFCISSKEAERLVRKWLYLSAKV